MGTNLCFSLRALLKIQRREELELKVDDQAKSAVILNVLPQDKDRQS
jgi:hypothetical protein